MRGFTLLETIVALTLFLIVMASISQSTANQATMTRFSQLKAASAMAAQHFLDEIRAVDPATLPESGVGDGEVFEIDGVEYTVIPTYCEQPDWCEGTGARHIKATVYHNSEAAFETETIFTQLR